jgi:hypothetical protein
MVAYGAQEPCVAREDYGLSHVTLDRLQRLQQIAPINGRSRVFDAEGKIDPGVPDSVRGLHPSSSGGWYERPRGITFVRAHSPP